MKKVKLEELQFPCTVKAVLHNKAKRQALIYCEEPDWFVIAINLYKEEGSVWYQDSMPDEDFCDFYEPSHMEKILMSHIVSNYKQELDRASIEEERRTSGWWYKLSMKIARKFMDFANNNLRGRYRLYQTIESVALWINNDVLPF